MIIKHIYVVIFLSTLIGIIFTIRALNNVREYYGSLLKRTLIFGMIAVIANIMITVAMNATFAEIAYCIYFASINWILLYLTGFCLDYTEHEKIVRALKIPAMIVVILDSIGILLNPLTKAHFDIYETDQYNTVFYQTSSHPAYYVHLTIDYVAVVITLGFIIYRIVKSYNLYRQKYVLIFIILMLIVGLDAIYLAFSLVLDASVVFYGVAGILIYFSIVRFVPKKLMTESISMTIDDMKEGLILFDISDQCIFANAFSKSRFGVDEESFSFTREPLASIKASLAERGEEYGKTTYVERKDNGDEETEAHYRIRVNMLKDKKGRRLGSYLLLEDVTEEVSYLKQISDARNEADEANRAKSLFLANMSHEIRTPLNAVLGMNEMILREANDAHLLSYAENIRTSGNSLLNLINDILDFSRIEARKTEIIPVEYDLHRMLRECYFRFEKMANEKQLSFEIKCDPTLPSRLVGDEQHMIQVISNIISNAIKYTKRGGINFAIGMGNAAEEDEDPDKNGSPDGSGSMEQESISDRTGMTLVFTVSDTGIGIAENDIPYLFDAFQRVNEKENATIQGTGLGLAITKELVELMNGQIRVESTLGKGSTFTISIPQKIADKTPIGPFFEKMGEEQKPEYHEKFRAPDAAILIVDDVSVNLIVIRELLKKTGVRITTAESGDEAIEKCKNNKYDLILLDHRMPHKDGIETFGEIRAEGANMDTPVIMLTANALRGAEEEYRSQGFVDYLTKPVDSAELERSLAKYLPQEKVILE